MTLLMCAIKKKKGQERNQGTKETKQNQTHRQGQWVGGYQTGTGSGGGQDR